MKEFGFTADDGALIQAFRWDIQKPKGIVQIIHGMAEYITRYDEFAQYLNSRGFLVFGEDHRGHGKTAGKIETLGYFADSDGWNKVIGDNAKLGNWLRDEYPDVPFYIFGHSMGSFMTRKLIAEQPEGISKVILSGTGDFSKGAVIAIKAIAGLQSVFLSKKAKAKFLDKIAFSSMNNQFNPGRTGFEWLSRDEQKVDEYIADPYCGFVVSLGFYLDFAYGVNYLKSETPLNSTPKDLPILFYSGEKDPVGGNGKFVKAVAERYKNHGFNNIELEFNSEGHHESINEINRTEIYKFFADWLEK